MVIALLMDRHATTVARRTIGHRCIGPGEAHQLDAHPPHTVNRTDKDGHQATSSREEEVKAVASSSRKALPTRRDKEVSQRTRILHCLR